MSSKEQTKSNFKADKKHDKSKGSELPSRVAQIYYRHGLFITSYPTCSTSLAILAILLCCYPLLNFSPLPGKIPTKVIIPLNAQHASNYSHFKDINVEHDDKESNSGGEVQDHLNNNNNINLVTNLEQQNESSFSSTLSASYSLPSSSLSWARSQPPFIYVQQVIMRSIVLPWNQDLMLTDAFRAPLFEAFKLLEIINNHETNVTLSNLCLHVDNIKRTQQKDVLFPEYNCLILSPANFWKQNIHNFNKDNCLLGTIFQHHNNQKSKVSTAEMLLGVPIYDSGLKRYPVKNRPRVIQYAVTLILKERNQEFITSLEKKLHTIYPLHQHQEQQQQQNHEEDKNNSSVTFIYYPGEFNLIELVPFSIALTVLFVYMHFSIRKVEMIRSRFIVALSSVITVLGSLVMSVGFCFFFGLNIWVQSSMGVYPYLLILVGLENCLVLTKSVMTTENNLDVKIRVAQGLMREGWAITKNLMTEITILTAGLVLTFLPFLQEFCIFAIVGLVSDYFLQMFLFSTVLGLNVKRVDVEMEVKKLPKMYADYSLWNNRKEIIMTRSLNRSKSHPSQLSEIVGTKKKDHKEHNSKASEKKIPKRLRIVNFWARTRLFQRGFMIWMVLWISNIIYTSGIIENVFMIENNSNNSTSNENVVMQSTTTKTTTTMMNEMHGEGTTNNYETMVKNLSNIMMDYYTRNIVDWKSSSEQHNVTDRIQKLRHPQYELSNKLSNFHWASILKQYNITMIGHYVTILPSIKISHVVPLEVAEKVRNPNELPPSTSKWNALTAALDPLDLNDADEAEEGGIVDDLPLYPKTPMEIVLLAILCTVSVFVITYTMIVMYRCICSRNYAEWRSSRWDDSEIMETMAKNNEQQVLEGYPIPVKGHKHNIECVVSDGNLIATSCLQNIIKIWSSTNGELVAEINRVSYFEQLQAYNIEQRKMSSPPSSESEENLIKQPQQQNSNQVRLRTNLNFDFQSSRLRNNNLDSSSSSCMKNEFQKSYEKNFEIIPVKKSNEDNFYEMNSSFENGSKYGNHINNYNSNNALNRINSSDNVNYMQQQQQNVKSSPIWSLDFIDNLIVIGCADGRLEFWEGTTGSLRTIYENDATHGDGVTHVKLASDKVIAARLSGHIDFYRLETYTQGRHIDWNFTSAYRRTHIRTSSAGSLSSFNQSTSSITSRNVQRNSLNLSSQSPPSSSNISHSPTQEELRCILETQHPGHTQPITTLDLLGNVLFTGSQDHTLKVFHTDSNTLHFTLHGHCSPITTLIIDHFLPGTGCSGSQNGLLCLWDVVTGACLYNLQAHEDCLVSIASAPSYIVTLGLDERIRVWERFQGHLLNTINLHQAHSNSIVMLTPSLLITAKPGALLVSDVKDGHVKHEVKLDRSEMSQQITPKILLPSYGQIICDFGHELRIVRFPLHDKNE